MKSLVTNDKTYVNATCIHDMMCKPKVCPWKFFLFLWVFFFALFHLFWGNVRSSKGKHYIIQNSRENNIIQNSRENKLKIRNDINIKN